MQGGWDVIIPFAANIYTPFHCKFSMTSGKIFTVIEYVDEEEEDKELKLRFSCRSIWKFFLTPGLKDKVSTLQWSRSTFNRSVSADVRVHKKFRVKLAFWPQPRHVCREKERITEQRSVTKSQWRFTKCKMITLCFIKVLHRMNAALYETLGIRTRPHLTMFVLGFFFVTISVFTVDKQLYI